MLHRAYTDLMAMGRYGGIVRRNVRTGETTHNK